MAENAVYIQEVICELRDAQCFVPVGAVDQIGFSVRVQEGRHIPAVVTVGADLPDEPERACRRVCHRHTGMGGQIVGRVKVEPKDEFSCLLVVEYFGALAYAAMFGIEMIPCVQTLAHLRTALRWPAMMGYRDNEDILIAGEEKTYEFIDAMLKSLSEMYASKKIHLGMDEAFYLGYGNYRRKNGVPNQGELIKRHLERVLEICRKYGMEPMIWSDMFFVNAGGGNYYNVPADHEWPEEERPDPSVTLVYWDYEGHDKDRYARMTGIHKKLTDRVCFAGVSWIWNGLAPNYAKALDATGAAFAGLKEAGVQDTFLTLWLDNGAETPMKTGLPMMAAYSAYMYGEEPTGKEWRVSQEGAVYTADTWAAYREAYESAQTVLNDSTVTQQQDCLRS